MYTAYTIKCFSDISRLLRQYHRQINLLFSSGEAVVLQLVISSLLYCKLGFGHKDIKFICVEASTKQNDHQESFKSFGLFPLFRV